MSGREPGAPRFRPAVPGLEPIARCGRATLLRIDTDRRQHHLDEQLHPVDALGVAQRNDRGADECGHDPVGIVSQMGMSCLPGTMRRPKAPMIRPMMIALMMPLTVMRNPPVVEPRDTRALMRNLRLLGVTTASRGIHADGNR